MADEQMTRRQRRLLEKEKRAKAQNKSGKSAGPHVFYILGLLVLVAIIGAIVYGSRKGETNNVTPKTSGTYTDGPVHWHANFEVDLCGAKQDFSSYGAVQHAGSSLLHTHGDGVIHIEGRIISKEDIALGRFFDEIDIPFGRDRIMHKKNGDECTPGKPGQVKMFVNGQATEEFRDYIPKATENGNDQVVKIVFE